MIRFLGLFLVIGPLFCKAAIADAPNNAPFDPVMGLFFSPSRSKFWIFAQVSRPEGVHMVIAGPIWTYPGTTPPSTKPVLEPVDSFGEVILVHDGKCMPYADPDNLFNGPTPAQTGLANDLAKSLIDRSVRAFHSAPGFLTALKNQGLTGDKLDPILRPLINSLRKKQALTSFRDRKPSIWLILSPCSRPSRTPFARR
jgi:hypothetical protein